MCARTTNRSLYSRVSKHLLEKWAFSGWNEKIFIGNALKCYIVSNVSAIGLWKRYILKREALEVLEIPIQFVVMLSILLFNLKTSIKEPQRVVPIIPNLSDKT